MIHYIIGTDLWLHPSLAHTMFSDRTAQFSGRLKWEVDVDSRGYERDQYDILNPIYVIVGDKEGHHAGSMRLLPTTGRTMINEHFDVALEDGQIRSPWTWECTRFCLSPSAGIQTAEKLFAGAGYLMQELEIASLIAVFDRIMLRKYRLSGVAPEILGEGVVAGATVLTGRWAFGHKQLIELMLKASLDPLECELALVNSSIGKGQERKLA